MKHQWSSAMKILKQVWVDNSNFELNMKKKGHRMHLQCSLSGQCMTSFISALRKQWMTCLWAKQKVQICLNRSRFLFHKAGYKVEMAWTLIVHVQIHTLWKKLHPHSRCYFSPFKPPPFNSESSFDLCWGSVINCCWEAISNQQASQIFWR